MKFIKKFTVALALFFPITLMGLLGIPIAIWSVVTNHNSRGTSGLLGVFICTAMVLLSLAFSLVLALSSFFIFGQTLNLSFLVFAVGYFVFLLGELTFVTQVVD